MGRSDTHHSRCLAGIDGKVSVKGNAHGIRNGWFNWLYNFDPIWLDECDGFEAKAAKVGAA